MRLNLGCGAYPMSPAAGSDWWNVDADPATPADAHYRFPPLDASGCSVDEVYLGHVLEHFDPEEAQALLRECRRVLTPGGRLGVVVPDTKAILGHYLLQDDTEIQVPEGRFWNLDDLDAVCSVFLYSSVQESAHKWSYDGLTLRRALVRAGFVLGPPIHPWQDPRVAVGAWWNLGQDAFRPVEGER